MKKHETRSEVYFKMLSTNNITDENLEKLLSLSKKFCHFREGCLLASEKHPVWKKKFLERMFETAERTSHWRAIAFLADRGSLEWKTAKKELLENARHGKNISHRWENLASILPNDHSLMPEVKSNLSRIRKTRRKKGK
jgi:hypothetical protein